jgi:hypothetical protein
MINNNQEKPMQIVELNSADNMSVAYVHIGFKSVAEAEGWLETNGFEKTELGSWMHHCVRGILRLWVKFHWETVDLEGDVVARISPLMTLENIELEID